MGSGGRRRGERRVLAVVHLNDVELATWAPDEVDLPAAGRVPDVQALGQDERLDQPLGLLGLWGGPNAWLVCLVRRSVAYYADNE